jgi:hypothetical protein
MAAGKISPRNPRSKILPGSTLAAVVITAAVCCAIFIARDFGRDIQRDIHARQEFVATANRLDGGQGITFRTAGLLDTTMVFDGVPCDGADCQELLDQTMFSREALDRNYRGYLVQIGFKTICVNGLCADLPNTESLQPANGTPEYNFEKVARKQ